MKNATAQKRFESALMKLMNYERIWTVFGDFLDYSLKLLRWWDVKQEDFAKLEQKYPGPENAKLMAEAYFAMVEIADNCGSGFKDPFGDFFMEHLSSERAGQFFTPETICDFMAMATIGPDLPDGKTVHDPACGSGRCLLSVGKINRKALFYGADIDLTCCKMTVINLMLNTMCGEVWWMNTISQERWKTWKLDKLITDTGHYLPYYTEIEHPPSPPETAPNPETLSARNVQTKVPAPNKKPLKHLPKKTRSNKTRLNPITNLKINFQSFNKTKS